MTNELQAQIDLLKAEIAALKDDRLPKVDRASKRRDRRQVLGGFGMFAVALTVAGTLSASALAGTNTVFSDDIRDGQVYTTDIHDSTVSGTDVRNDSLTGADINESTLTLPAPTIADGSITEAKLAQGSVTADKLYGGTFDFLQTYTVQSATVQVAAGQNGNAEALCGNGTTHTDGIFGGGGHETQPGVDVWAAKGNTSQYGVWVKNTTAQTQPLTVYINCIRIKRFDD